MGICAFCGKDRKLTREHVFPDFIEKNREREGLYYSSSAKKYLRSAPVVKDVCSDCNNVILGSLDAYASKLFTKYFNKEIRATKSIQFDRDILLRWLLKVLFNAQRSFNRNPTIFFPYRSYMIGMGKLPYDIYLLSCVMKSGKLNGKEVKARDIRVSDLRIPELDLGVQFSLCHSVTINSYSFILISFLNRPTEKALNRTFKFLKKNLGCEPEKIHGELKFNIKSSKIDHVTHKGLQRLNNPWIYPNNGIVTVGKDIIKLTNFPSVDAAGLKTIDEKMSIISISVDGNVIPLINGENIIGGLTEYSQPIEQAISNVALSSNANAKVVRKGGKTYVTVNDLNEPDAPFMSQITGISQSTQNWNTWQTAIEQHGCIYLCTDFDVKDINKTLVHAAVKVVSVREQS